VITNIEAEHLDHFKSLRQILAAYRAFADNLKNGGMLFHNIDDWNVKDALKGFRKRRGTFGLSSEADLSAVSIRMNGFETSFICTRKCRKLGEVRLKIPGLHNVLNSLAAISVGLELGLGFEKIRDAIRDFGGVKRRFQLRADAGGAMLIDDYAHHPTEIEAVLKTCRRWSGRRVIAVFQPHRYTRTKLLADSFGKCFKNADKLILTDIYAASEKPIKGVSIRTIRDKVVESGFNNVEIVKKERIADRVMGFKKPGDMIVVMGAGDIKKIADELAERLNGAPETALLSKLKRLVKGNILFSEPLCRHTSFGIGGPAAVWVEPADTGDLRRVLIYAKKKGLPLFVIGGGTKMLVSDRGFRGIAVHLGSDAFKRVRIKGNVVKVGAGFNMSRLVKLCCESAIAGLESLVGIPGTIGGAIYMNAGGAANPIYRNIGGFVRSVKVMDYSGGVRNLGKDDLKFGYRCSNLEKYIILEATLGLKKGDAALLNSSCRRFLNIKKEKQVLDMPSAGCVFKNPRDVQFTCGQMIDMLGLKGTMRGAAAISGKHANFIVNIGKASSDDVLELIGLIRDKVKKSFNIPLELEIKVI
jgi:UDP-N-acetylenolpyruvoylglucosamine reductase